MDSTSSSKKQGRPSRVGFVAACCSLAWLTAEFVGEPAAFGVVSILVLTIAFIPPSKRQRPWIFVFGAISMGTCLTVLFGAVLSGLSGPVVIWLMAAVMVSLGLAVPLIFALTFPKNDSRKLR